MSQEIKISVIMPVYKVEAYVGKAIESIQNQTLTDWEFLIVDDGTPDNSGKICDEYAAKDSRLQVFHKENGGAPSARNMAIEKARGKYMYFMDSDDWAEPTMLEDMYRLAEENEAQLVIAGFYIDTYYGDQEYVTTTLSHPDTVYATQQEFRENAYKLFDKNLLYTPWNKLFQSKYLMENNLRFPQTWMDDFPFNLKVIRDIEKVVVTSKQYYHFMRARAESETAKYRSDMYPKREEEHGWMLDLYDHWNVHDPDSMEMLYRRYIERVIGCIENVTNDNCTLNKAERKAAIREIITNPRVDEALRYAKPKSTYMKLMLMPIRWKNVSLCYREGRTISGVKTKHVKTFAKLKAGR
jgi:glycosyltransferase involved in cell wall biosynthesis